MCVDLVVTGDDVAPRFGQVERLVGDYTLEMGGSCCLFACQAAKLGLRVGILGRVGDDGFGRLILRRLHECGVDTHSVIVDAHLKTGLGIALCQGDDRAILTYLGTLSVLRPEDVTDDFLASARHLHHGSFFLQNGLRAAMPAIFRRAHTLGLTTSLDPNWDPDERWNSTLAELLDGTATSPNSPPLTDLFLPNLQEAQHITCSTGLDEAIERLRAKGLPLSVIKGGAAGAWLVSQDFTLRCAVQPAAPGGDGIGAGSMLRPAQEFPAGGRRVSAAARGGISPGARPAR